MKTFLWEEIASIFVYYNSIIKMGFSYSTLLPLNLEGLGVFLLPFLA